MSPVTVDSLQKAVPTYKPRLSFVIPEETKAKLEILADQENRSVSNFVLNLVLKEIDKAELAGKFGDGVND